MYSSSFGALTFALLLAVSVGAAPQDVLTLRGPGAQVGATFRDVHADPVARRDRGAVVVAVQEKSPAATSGLRAGDLVTVFDRVDVRDSRDLNKLISETPPGRTVDITVVRQRRTRILKLTPAPGR